MIQNVKQDPPAIIGMQVKVIPPDGIPIFGEVVAISNKVTNLITKVRVATNNGFQTIDVEDLVVEAVQIIKEVRKSTIFQAIWSFFKGLFAKK